MGSVIITAEQANKLVRHLGKLTDMEDDDGDGLFNGYELRFEDRHKDSCTTVLEIHPVAVVDLSDNSK